VADESAFAQFAGQMSHDMSIPPGYTSVSVEKICQPDFKELQLEITVGDVLHGIILWPKHYIVIIPENDGSPIGPPEPGPSS
jgi:hypothetical protein